MTVFISVPMNGRSNDEIWNDVNEAYEAIPKIFPDQELAIVYNQMQAGPECAGRLYFLGSAIQKMSGCDAVYFCKGWESAKGCQVEHYICELYGIQRIEA